MNKSYHYLANTNDGRTGTVFFSKQQKTASSAHNARSQYICQSVSQYSVVSQISQSVSSAVSEISQSVSTAVSEISQSNSK